MLSVSSITSPGPGVGGGSDGADRLSRAGEDALLPCHLYSMPQANVKGPCLDAGSDRVLGAPWGFAPGFVPVIQPQSERPKEKVVSCVMAGNARPVLKFSTFGYKASAKAEPLKKDILKNRTAQTGFILLQFRPGF